MLRRRGLRELAHSRVGLGSGPLLGAEFLPILADADLQVEPEQVPAFLRECLLLRENLERIVAGMTEPVMSNREPRTAISERLANIENAAGRARVMGGGVLVR